MKKDNWILKAFLYTFFIALFFNAFSNTITNKFDNLIILTLLTILFIFIGIIFDIIGTAVLTADESTFHAKSTKRIKGAKEGVYLIKNGSRFVSCSNFPKCHFTRKLPNENVAPNPEENKPVKDCPDCDGYLIKKKGRFGYFLGCINYPKCSHMERIPRKKPK